MMRDTPSNCSNLTWAHAEVTADERQARLNPNPMTFWLTGLSGSGKSTLAFRLEKALLASNRAAFVLDGDNIRSGLNRDLAFSPADRAENIRRTAEVAWLMNEAGVSVVVSLISPTDEDRSRAREIIGGDRFREIYLSTPLAVCEARDPKGLYRKARAGQIAEFTGISAPYQAPKNPDVTLDTSSLSVEQCVANVLALLDVSLETSVAP